MKPIIYSILDNDLYKFTMQNAVLKTMTRPTNVVYQFKNRRSTDKFTPEFIGKLKHHIVGMGSLELSNSEMWFLQDKCPYFDKEYLTYLKNFHFDPSTVTVGLTADHDLDLTIRGDWKETILWEVPLMALISEIYFQDYPVSGDEMTDFYYRTKNKYLTLRDNGCSFSEFGTRRRRSRDMQTICMSVFNEYRVAGHPNDVTAFTGTSNVYFAQQCNCPVVGTMAHEWIMGNSAFDLENANENSLQIWANIYRGKLGIALTDTFGTNAFFKAFDGYLARLYDGVRHDSGDALVFADKVVTHYEKLGIDPATKKIIFSDGLNVDECVRIKNHCGTNIKCSFGIGTNFTNDMPGQKALNMVIKLRSVDGKEVVKISDTPGKATGDAVALATAFKTFGI